MERLIDLILSMYGPTPYFVIFGVLMICGLGLPIPEDITLFVAGLSAYYGLTSLPGIIAVSYFGVILGDSLIFSLGAVYGRKLTKQWFFHKLLPDEQLQAVRAQLQKKGSKFVFAARFMPGFRAPLFFSAGTLHMQYKVFLFFDGLAALVSVPTIILAVYYFGDQLDKVVRVIHKIEHGIFLVIVFVVFAIFAKWYITHRKLKK